MEKRTTGIPLREVADGVLHALEGAVHAMRQEASRLEGELREIIGQEMARHVVEGRELREIIGQEMARHVVEGKLLQRFDVEVPFTGKPVGKPEEPGIDDFPSVSVRSEDVSRARAADKWRLRIVIDRIEMDRESPAAISVERYDASAPS